jgi:hypothetical protein
MLYVRSDNWTPQQFDDLQQIIEGIAQLRRDLTPKVKEWEATVQGAGTPGTYELQQNFCRSVRIGRLVFLFLNLKTAAVITAGGTDYIQITGIPYSKIADTLPQGSVYIDGVNFVTTGANLSLSFISFGVSNILYINESVDNIASAGTQISGLGAADTICGSICYETDDPE